MHPRESSPSHPAVAAIVALLLSVVPCGAKTPAGQDWQRKVHPVLLERQPAELMIYLDDQADPAWVAGSKGERGARVYRMLTEHASRTQAPLLRWLEAHDVEHRSFWIANLIWVRGDRQLLETLARRADVRHIDANPRLPLDRLPEPESAPSTRAVSAVEWNLSRVNADQLWALGYTGQGVVVAGQDTGYQWNHPALIDQYRGWDGVSADHDYHWHDAIHSGGGICGADAAAPCDDNGHGTHTLGTMIGDDGGVNQIGMAPEARWIGCRNMDQGNGTPATYTECFQWFVAPTDLNGQNPDPGLAPDVINNSWACPTSEGCFAATLQTVVENTRAAGIVVVSSAGNSGSACGSVINPPAIYDASISVGATDASDAIASFSSRGPVTVDGSNRLKPDVTAPGVGVRSSALGGTYATLQGTSVAAPHVAGLVALLLDARPDLRGRVDEIESLITLTAEPLTSLQDCGGVSGTAVPNNTFGHGRIDALRLLDGDVDGDGFSNLDDCLPVDASAWGQPSPAWNLRMTDATTLTWAQPIVRGAASLSYDVVRSTSASDYSGATCVAQGITTTAASDTTLPTELFVYVVRVRNPCGANLGSSSAGVERIAPSCP